MYRSKSSIFLDRSLRAALRGGPFAFLGSVLEWLGSPARQGWRWVLPILVATATVSSRASAQWVEPPGQGWASLTVYHQDTRSIFLPDGTRDSFVLRGHAVASSAYFTADLGLLPGVDTWLQFSFQRLVFEDQVGKATSTGAGDSRFYLRASPLVWFGSQLPFAIRAGVKLPVQDIDVGQELIPLGDGQRDWELIVELGRSLYPRPLYLMGWLGYRWREAVEQPMRDFGDERFFLFAIGGTQGRFGYKLITEGWYGRTPSFGGLTAMGQERELLRLNPTVSYGVGPGSLELGGRFPLTGKNLPAGPDLQVGYFSRFGLWN